MQWKIFNKKSAYLKSNANMDSPPAGVHPRWVVVLVSVYLATCGNIALWFELYRLPEMNDTRALLFAAAFVVLIASLIGMLLSLFNWRWTLKPVVILFLIVATFGAYFMLSYGVVIDGTMMLNVLQTDIRESRDLISWHMLATVIVFVVLPAFWLWRTQVRQLSVLSQIGNNALIFALGLMFSVIAVLPIYQDFASVMRNHIQLRFLINPLNSFYALGDALYEPVQKKSQSVTPIGTDAVISVKYHTQPKAPMLVLVVGETARSANFGINGYAKDTTPNLSLLKRNADKTGALVSFENAWSCGTSTAISLPCMFSHIGREAFDSKDNNLENLIDVLKRAGLAMIWLENQSGCKGVCDRIAAVATGRLNNPKYCVSGECFDGIMLDKLAERLQEFPPEQLDKGVVIIMHQMGSHGPAYYKRAPEAFKKFLPECKTNMLQECTRDELVNAYDNTLLYNDYFLNKVVDFLKDKEPHVQTAMVYVSDHGESLGENNIYLHGLPYAIAPDVQKRIPWISWLSNDFLERKGMAPDCLNQKKNQRISHDNYFHSILGLMDIKTSLYNPALDIYASCSTK